MKKNGGAKIIGIGLSFWVWGSALALPAAATDTVSIAMIFSSQAILAKGLWAEGRRAELDGEYGLAAVSYFRAYHLYDVLFQETDSDSDRVLWGEKKLQAYTDGLAAVRRYESVRRVRVDLIQLLDQTRPKLITTSRTPPKVKEKVPGMTLFSRPLPGDLTPPPEVESQQESIFGGGKTLVLPGGIGQSKTQLLVRGRKFIGWTTTATRYDKPSELRKNTKDVKVDQQLQIQIGGNVAFQFQEALTVNVRFDDREDDQNQKQAISIRFDPKKDVQTPLGPMHPVAEFGDVNLVLEGTTYAVYNKSLFGLNGSLDFHDFHFFDLFRAKRFGARFIATQTRGISAHREFSGQNTLVVKDISDITFISKIYYDLLANVTAAARTARLPIKVNSERILRDDRSSSSNTANTLLNKSVTGIGKDTFTGDFDILTSGQDYFIDYSLGILQFKSSLAGNAVIAVSFTGADASLVTDSMIKNENVTDSYKVFELKNRYSLGSNNIIRNDPDFIVEIRDLNNKSFLDADSDGKIGANDIGYNLAFGLDANGDGKTDEKNIDFDFGILTFPDSSPFISEAFPGLSNTEIYTTNVPTQKYKIHVEFVQKTNVYLLNPSIVKNSEIIVIDGVKMVRDQDYFIDYVSGFLQFLRPELITSKSLIVVDYEYFPFTSKSNQTLIGTGLNMEISDNVGWAATFVSNFDDKPSDKPHVGEEPKKVDISDVAVHVNPMGMLKDGIRNWTEPPKLLDKFSLNFNFENATSRFNFNTNGEAVLGDFEDAGLIDRLSISKSQWRPDIPDGFSDTARGTFSIDQVSEQGHLDGLANVSSDDIRAQSSLKVDYTFVAGTDTYLSVSFHISDIAQDFSKKTFLEFWVKDANKPDVTLDVGILNEDADNDGLLDSEDGNKDNLLNSGEDVGIKLGDLTVGNNNGLLDSEDRDKDGVLDQDQAFFRARLNDPTVTDTVDQSNGWRQYRVFLSNLVASGFNNQTATLKTVKDLRLTFSKAGIGGGSILINDISIQGVSWEDDNFSDTKSFVVGVVSNRTDPSFTPPPSVTTSSVQTLDAKALSLSYTALQGKHITKFLPATDVRLSLYKTMTYWVKASNATGLSSLNDTFIFRFGPDENNYFEITKKIADAEWAQTTVNLEVLEEDLIKLNIDTSPPFNTVKNGVRIFGAPTLDRIRFLGAGVQTDSVAGGKTGRIYLDEIIVKDVEEEQGSANKSSFTSSLFDNLITLNGDQEIVDNTFRPIGRINYTGVGDYVPQDIERTGYAGTVNFSKFSFLDRLLKLSIPVSFSKRREKTFINPDLVENVKRSDLGNRSSEAQALGFSVSRNSKWPSFNAGWSKLNEDVNQKTFVSKQENTDRNYTVSYGKDFDRKIFWIIPIGRVFSYNASFGRSTSVKDRDVLFGTEKNTFQKSITDAFGLNVHYTITRWFDWSFNASQSLSRQTLSETVPIKENARSRSYGWNWPFPAFLGFTPSLNWTFSFSENVNNENENKAISSSGGFGATVGLQPQKWWRLLKFLTLAYSFTINGSASYQNVPERFGLAAVFDNFYKNIFFFWKGGNLEITSDTLVLLRNSASTNRSHTFGGGIAIWKSLSTTYSTSFNRAEIQSLNSIDLSDAFSFNLNNTLNLTTASRWFRKKNSAALTYSYALNSSKNKTTQTKNITNSLSWPVSWTERLRTNLTGGYTFGSSRDRLSVSQSGNTTSDLTLSYLLSNPFKISTFTGNFLRFENRFELTTGMKWNHSKSEVDEVKKTDAQSYGGNLGLTYDLRENFRITGGASYAVNTSKLTPDADQKVSGMSATAELRF